MVTEQQFSNLFRIAPIAAGELPAHGCPRLSASSEAQRQSRRGVVAARRPVAAVLTGTVDVWVHAIAQVRSTSSRAAHGALHAWAAQRIQRGSASVCVRCNSEVFGGRDAVSRRVSRGPRSGLRSAPTFSVSVVRSRRNGGDGQPSWFARIERRCVIWSRSRGLRSVSVAESIRLLLRLAGRSSALCRCALDRSADMLWSS
jgi:hypothetical protein